MQIGEVKTRGDLECWAGVQRTKTPSEINLIARRGTVHDVAHCHSLHKSTEIPYSESSRRVSLEIWRALVSHGDMQLFLVEDRSKPLDSRLVAFGATVFVTDAFCLEARTTVGPYVGIELTRRYSARRFPVLNRGQVAHANRGDGLNALMCFEGWAQDGFSSEQLLAIRKKRSDAFHLALRGYRVKEFLANPIGLEASQWMIDAGARLRRDYSNYFRKHRLREPEQSRRPWLLGLTKQEAFMHPGSSIAGLFIYTPPRFHFTSSEQALLQQALIGETCDKLATSLSLSLWTVKKRWHAIYERVADVDGDLLPPAVACSANASARGAERRRYLLNYLRQHFEELRPYEASQGRQPPARGIRGYGWKR